MQKDNYALLIEKLDLFIRKYYLNKLIKGAIYSTAFIVVLFLLITILEYNFFFSPNTRKFLFIGFIVICLSILAILVLVPYLKLKNLGKTINHVQAAEIIGNHFSNVKDKLLNVLQLKSFEGDENPLSLIHASINQKTEEMKLVPFSSAINLNDNIPFLKYAIPPLLLFFVLLFIKPNLLKDSTQRIIQNNIIFEKPMPFLFILKNDSLKTTQFDDFLLELEMTGEKIPNNVFLHRKNSTNNNYTKTHLLKINSINYTYLFSNIQENTSFYFSANEFNSKEYFIEVSQKPIITNFVTKLKFPNYLKLKNKILNNEGDLSVPIGTSVGWIFDAIATDKIFMRFSGALKTLNKSSKSNYNFSKMLSVSEQYSVVAYNKNANFSDSIEFNINVVNDEFPKILVKEQTDSSNIKNLYYIGEISDDHGLTKLNFTYSINKKTETIDKNILIPISKNSTQEFTHFWNIDNLNLDPGDKLSYYFTVWDNDGYNGSKFSKSKKYQIEIPSKKELENKSDKELETIKKDLITSIEKSQELQKELKEFKKELLSKKDLSWEDKKQMEKMLDQQKKLQNKISSLSEKFQKNIETQSEFKKINPEIVKKQEQVQKLFDDVLEEEMKELIEKYEKMLSEFNKEESLEQTEEMELTDQELEKELDRMLEMLKKLEFEQKQEETKEKLEELAEKQEELSEKENKQENQQEELNEEFEEIQEEILDLEKLDEELNNDSDFEKLKEESEKTAQEMQNSKENISKNDKKATKSQKSAAKKLKEMAQLMGEMALSMQSKSMEEDMESLRQLLENLITLSFEEERILTEFKTTKINTPKYTLLSQDQYKLIDNSKLVEDSLFALAKRVFEIESFITDKIFEINRNLLKAVEYLEARTVHKSVVNQQYAMTGYNDLALMLSEVMQQMQMQMAQDMPGNQTCEKPGNGKPGKGKIPSLKQMQKQLSDQISEMGKKGEKGAGSKPGEQSKKLARMAAKQQAIREALQELNKSENGGGLQKTIDKMKQNEIDLVNKNISNELIQRQKEILTKLLEAENAEKERDEKKERIAESAKELINNIPPDLKEYLKKRKSSLLLYEKLPPRLKPFYKSISKKYFKNSTNN